MHKFAIIVAGGSGSRMKSEVPKQFLPLNGEPILMRTIRAFYSADQSIQIVLSLPAQETERWNELCETYDFKLLHQVVIGGATRYHSVLNGLDAISAAAGIVAVHDGVRPLISPAGINKAYEVAFEKGSAVTAVALKDSIRKINSEGRSEHQDRDLFMLVQTPQTFGLKDLKEAYALGFNETFTDDASVYEASGREVTIIKGEYSNIKITTPEDLIIAEAIIKKEK